MNRQVKIFVGAVTMAFAIGIATSAQAPVTITMRSGETMAVSLVDMGARGFEVRVNGEQRFIAKDQVALVDFGGAVSVQNRWFASDLNTSRNLVVFKNGDTMLADWTDVGGTTPLVLRFNTGSAEREVSANEVARIYLVAPAGLGTTGSSTGVPAGSIAVAANTAWTSAGITVRTGEYLRFAVSGEIRFGAGTNDVARADGNPAGTVNTGLFRRLPVQSLPVGGLIGKVGNGAAFSIGSAPQAIRMPSNGQLFLGINDLTFNDNSGSFQVVVTRGQ